MGGESGGGGTSWGEEAERETSGRPIGAADTARDMDQTSQQSGADSSMSVGAGMGGFNSYDPASSISTSVDDAGGGEGSGGGDRSTAEQGSTGGLRGGAG